LLRAVDILTALFYNLLSPCFSLLLTKEIQIQYKTAMKYVMEAMKYFCPSDLGVSEKNGAAFYLETQKDFFVQKLYL